MQSTGNPPPSAASSRAPYSALLYHYIGPVEHESCRGLTVIPQAFASQMKALSAMGYTSITPSQIADPSQAISERSLLITFDDAYEALETFAFPILERVGLRAAVFVPTALLGGSIPCSPRSSEPTLKLMTADRISHWASRGFEFGAHTRTHADLTTLDPEQMEEEVTGSRDDLAAITGRPVVAFAYPYGRYDVRSASFVNETFPLAFTAESGMNDAGTPPHMLRRTMVQHSDSVVDVCLRARYGSSIFERIKTRASAAIRGERVS
ncbi:MAG: polysaccharide deacetylase family protein [Gemmatimonadaceae bacterium]